MSPELSEVVKIGATAASSGVAVIAGLKRYLNGGVKRIETKLDEHIVSTGHTLSDVVESTADIRERQARIEGLLGVGWGPGRRPR